MNCRPIAEDPEAPTRMRSELADVAIAWFGWPTLVGIDLIEAARAKLAESERRYDAENYRGSARKAPAMP
jgi:hypothetical protein